jgi:hypothetical protein
MGILDGLANLVGGYFGQVQAAKQQAIEAPYRQQLLALLGQAPDNPELAGLQGPPSPGSGLLANPNDPQRQLAFASGIMGLPGQMAQGSQLLNAAFQRAQAGQQFEQQEGRLGSQFERTYQQQGAQWQAGHDLARQQLQETIAYRDQSQQNWLAQFQQQQRQFAAQQSLERQRLELARNADERAQAALDARGGLPAAPAGQAWVASALGPVLAPLPGTKDYAVAVDTDGAFETATARIDRMLAIMQGEERTVGGRKVRAGGSGSTALTGEKAAELSSLRAELISDIAKLRNLGVLQGGEMERIDEALPDPTKVGSLLSSDAYTFKAYGTLKDQFKAKAATHRTANPWLLPAPPPGTRPIGGR